MKTKPKHYFQIEIANYPAISSGVLSAQGDTDLLLVSNIVLADQQEFDAFVHDEMMFDSGVYVVEDFRTPDRFG